MMRFISVLFLLLGLVAAAYGGARLAGIDLSPYGLGPAPVSTPAPVAIEAPPPPPPSSSPRAVLEEAAPLETVQPATVPDVPSNEASARGANAPEPRFNRALRSAAPAESVREETEGRASFIERLYNVPVAYETPKTASYRKPFDVTFAVDATGDSTAVDALPGEDTNIVETSAKISDRIKANLVGGAFEIELQSPDVQRVSLLEENVWRWQVTPIEAGKHTLILELFALEDGEAIPVRTLNDKIEVSVSTFQRAVSFATHANPLFVVLGGIGSAIGGLFGFFRFFAGKGKV